MTAHEPSHACHFDGSIGLIAGAGSVPKEIAEAVIEAGRDVHVIALRGIADADYTRIPHSVVGLGQVGRMLGTLRANACRKLIISGALQRPNLLTLVPDVGFFLNLPAILGLMRGGDDTILRKVLRFFEDKGFEPVGIPDIAPALLASAGPITKVSTSESIEADTQIAFRVVDRLAPFDIGQAVVVRGGDVIGIEAAEGTDGLLLKLPQRQASGGVLVKATKPNQELRVDLPTIGPKTVEAASALNLSAIVIEAGRSVIAQRAETILRAEQQGICLVGSTRPTSDKEESANLIGRQQPGATHHNNHTDGTGGASVELHLAVRVLSEVLDYASTAAICVNRQRVLSIALGEEAKAIVANASRIGQWGDRSGKHRGASLAFSSANLLSEPLLTAAAQMGVRSIGYMECTEQTHAEELASLARQLKVELVDLS